MNIRWTLLCLLAGFVFVSSDALADGTGSIHVDIAAIETSNDLQPIDGITSSGQPDSEEFELVAEAGYVAVVDLRGENEDRGLDEEAVLEELGLDYVQLPLSSPDAISMENAAVLDQILSDYDGPVLVHCGSGNRVGALLALRQSMLGADDDDALAYGKSAGLTGLEPVVRSRLLEED